MSSLLERIVALLLLGALSWPAFSAIASRQYWQVFPRITQTLTLLLLGYLLCLLVVVYSVSLPALRALCAVGLIVLTGTLWYVHDRFGRRRRWPPGSLRPFSAKVWFDRDFFFKEHERLGSPFKCTQFVRPMVCLTGLAEGFEFLRMHDASLKSPPLPFGRFIPGGFLRHMAPDRHADTKAVLRKALAPEVYRSLEPFMREQVRAGIVRLVRDSKPAGGSGVPPRRYLQQVVFDIWARLFFGLEPGSGESKEMQKHFRVIDIRNPANASDAAIRHALDEILGIVTRSAGRPPHTAGIPPQSFFEALRANSPQSIDDRTITANLVYLMHTTWADVSSLWVWLMRFLTENPQWISELRSRAADELGEADPLSLSTRVVMETLRLAQSEYLYRLTTTDIRHKDFLFPRGWLVRICVIESHGDPAVFGDPSVFNPDRFLDRGITRHQFSPFGAGLRHACLGEELTIIAGRVLVEELVRGADWRTIADGPYEFSSWRHWRPASDWRVLVTSASG